MGSRPRDGRGFFMSVNKIFFNDPKIFGVLPRFLHDNHFHVELRK